MAGHVQLEAVSQLTIFSRVEPRHKTKLVELLKSQASSFPTDPSACFPNLCLIIVSQ
jgi:hypothetical protein